MTDEATGSVGFADFVRDRAPTLYRYGYVLTGNTHDADDLVQEALIRLRGAWSRVERRDDPTGYVRTTVIDVPYATPDGGRSRTWAAIDSTHLLISGGSALYAYNTADGSFRAIVVDDGVGQSGDVTLVGAASHWVVWSVHSDVSQQTTVYRAPMSGGTAQAIGPLPGFTGPDTPWFLTDDAIYWSGADGGVESLSLTDVAAVAQPMAGFSGYRITASSAWAISATPLTSFGLGQTDTVTNGLRNVLTGQRLVVVPPSGAEQMACALTFCVGRDSDGRFVQALDGSRRTRLPALPDTAGGDFVVLESGVALDRRVTSGSALPTWTYVYDPISGGYARLGGALFPYTDAGDGGVVVWTDVGTGGEIVLNLDRMHG